MMGLDVAVIGSGASGLAAAFRLRQAGHRVTVFESDDRVGGRMLTSQRDGFTFDHGATVAVRGYRSLLGIAEEAGLGSEVIQGGQTLAVSRDGAFYYIAADRLVRDALKTKLLSTRSKLTLARMGLDIVRVRKRLDDADLSTGAEFDNKSAEEYARQRLNPEILEYLVDPTVRALIGPSPAEVSVVDLLYTFEKFIGARFIAFRGGIQSFPEMLSRRFELRLQAKVGSIEEHGEGVDVTWADPNGNERTDSFAGCVVAVPAPVAAQLLPGLDPWRANLLRGIQYTKQVNPSFALSRPPANMPATVIEVPRSVHPGIMVILVEHNKAPGRVPEGKGALTVLTDPRWAEELMDEDDESAVKQVLEATETLLPGISNDVEFSVMSRWDRMGPHSPAGFWQEMRKFQSIRLEKDVGSNWPETSSGSRTSTPLQPAANAPHESCSPLSSGPEPAPGPGPDSAQRRPSRGREHDPPLLTKDYAFAPDRGDTPGGHCRNRSRVSTEGRRRRLSADSTAVSQRGRTICRSTSSPRSWPVGLAASTPADDTRTDAPRRPPRRQRGTSSAWPPFVAGGRAGPGRQRRLC
jgi:oxygen-dependent protoporphyrinogen oxidase